MFRKLLAGLGVGGASVETTLRDHNTWPGGVVEGQVALAGGDVDQDIEYVAVALAARVEVESGDSEYASHVAFGGQRLTGRFPLASGARHAVPFQLQIPWEAPITAIGGQPLRGVNVGVRTELEIARAADKGDLDPIAIHPLPAQQRLLDAFPRLGFRFKGADLEQGRVTGSSLPLYQEFEFYPAPQYARNINELEVTFLAGPQAMDVIVEVDKRGGLFTEGRDAYSRFTVDYRYLDSTDWDRVLHDQLTQLGQRRGWF